MRYHTLLVLYALLLLSLYSCSTSKKVYSSPKSVESIERKPTAISRNLPLKTSDSLQYLILNDSTLQNHFVGFILHDPEEEENIISINGNRPFTPASNMKLYTLYTALNILGDRSTALYYRTAGDSLIIRGAGDPSFLDPYQTDNNYVFDFLNNSQKKIYLDISHWRDEKFGSGWAWDDYQYSYQLEKSALPIYGNKFYLRKDSSQQLLVYPELFNKYIQTVSDSIHPIVSREIQSNNTTINSFKLDSISYHRDLPFSYSDQLLVELLSDTLNKKVEIIEDHSNIESYRVLKGMPIDTLYKKLMIVSDNFVAEQLLLMCSAQELGYMNVGDMISLASEQLLADMPDTIRWVDGSGLSRYNLVTPQSNIWILQQINRKLDFEKIKMLFPSGKAGDTLDPSFQYEKPWIFAKTGSLSNNFNLSGYLITKHNKKLLFSFMNNHYTVSRAELIQSMNRMLSFIRDHY